MPTTTSVPDDLAHRVEAFEAADPGADLGQFLPTPGDEYFVPVLAELIRVDLERAWARGERRRLESYRARYPEAFADRTAFAEVAFEEFRQRRLAGEPVPAAEYARHYGLDAADWPEIPPGSSAITAVVRLPAAGIPNADLGGPDTPPPRPASAESPDLPTVHVAVSPENIPRIRFPVPGDEFLDFRLEEELGRGSFGRVFLARQTDLRGRPVVLKIAPVMSVESGHLAQLQHTNIVPIYSFHTDGPLQAACMPYFGRTTLHHVLRSLRDRETVPVTGRDLKSTLRTGPPGGPAAAPPGPGPADGGTDAAPVPQAVGEDGWARFERLEYTQAVLLLARQLADGLAHAHARGIVHRDLKPANVLLTDDGRPMLLDFNIAEDVNARGGPAAIGGTLPYMAPEQMAAYRAGTGRVDARADLYAVGVILFELLTGRFPFPKADGAADADIAAMIAERRGHLPPVRTPDRRIEWAVQSIVHKCLAFDPARRYQSAEDLRDDLTRQIENRPLGSAPNVSARERLRKWTKRHPRLMSTASAGAAATVAVAASAAGFLSNRERVRGLEARDAFAAHTAAFRDAQVFLDDRAAAAADPDAAVARLRAVLDRYAVPDDPAAADAWQRNPAVRYLGEDARGRLLADVGESFYLLAKVGHQRAVAGDASRLEDAVRWNRAAFAYAADRFPRAVREQRADLEAVRGDTAAEQRAREESAAHPPATPRDRYLVGYWLAHRGQSAAALPHLRAATQQDPENFSAWFVRGTTHLDLGQPEMAALCFGSCTALRKEFAPAWLNRGLAYARLRFFDQACDDYGLALRLRPGWVEALLQRAAARDALGDAAGAEDDLTAALQSPGAPVRTLYLRAGVRDRMGKAAAAAADRAEALVRTPDDELSWVARGEDRIAADPAGALADAERALRLNPLSVYAMQLKAHLLAERLGRPDDAVAVLDTAVKLYPDYVPARAGRGVLLARADRRDAALADAREALARDTKAPNLYQVGCIYALTAKDQPNDRPEANRLIRAALRTGFGLDLVDTDPDLAALRADPEFLRLVAEAKKFFADRK